MKLIVGLGNPGAKYEHTRHNAGFMAVRDFRAAHEESFGGWSKKFNAEVSEGRVEQEKIVLLLPQTFMNLSGDAVAEAAVFWKVSPNDVILVHDDLDLPLGTLRLRPDGSAGGHNGVKSVIARLGTQEFARVRLGIGTELAARIPAEDFVLQRFAPDEQDGLKSMRQRAVTAIQTVIDSGLERAMNQFN